jgi:lipopolysaccharide biosynthesis regulator YciM
LSQVYAERKDYQRAIDTLKIVLKHKNDLDTRLLSDIYYNLSQDYKALNDQKQYSFYNEQYITLSRAIKESEMKAISSAINAEQKDYKEAISDADSSRKRHCDNLRFDSGFSNYLFALPTKKERKVFENIIEKLESDKNLVEDNLPSPLWKFKKNQ